MTATHDIVQKLWNLCNLLRDDGVTYMQYVTELTYLLFLKLLQEQDQEAMLPEGYRWDDLKQVGEPELIKFYKELLEMLGEDASQPKMQAIFVNAQSSLKKPTILKKLITNLDELNWYSAKEEGLGDLYEGLLQKNSEEKKSGAGQYFTPRPLIDSIVHLMRPQAGEIIQDPAAGTGFQDLRQKAAGQDLRGHHGNHQGRRRDHGRLQGNAGARCRPCRGGAGRRAL